MKKLSREDIINMLFYNARFGGNGIFWRCVRLAYDYYGLQYGANNVFINISTKLRSTYDLVEHLDYRIYEVPALIDIINEQLQYHRERR